MFWRFGGYANTSAIDTLLDKPDVTLEELLDESDLIQELKQHNTKLIEYLREDKVLERLLEYVIAPKPESAAPESEAEKKPEAEDTKGKGLSLSRAREADEEEEEKEKKRNRYAYVAAEILASDNWSICEALMENQPLLRKFWEFLKLPPPLDPLQASYFTKVNEALLDKKTEEMLDLFKSLEGAVKNMLQHVDSPMVMDLLLKIISLEKAEGGQGIVDWLHSQDLMPILLSFLSSEHSWATQTSAGDFLKAIITISANASQNEQSCIGPNELTRQLVSQPCIEKLISDMLKGGNPLTVGVGIVIEVIRKNNSDYDPEVGTEANAIPSSRDPIYLGTLLRMFAQRVPDFMELILSPNHTIGGGEDGPVTIRRKELSAAFGGKIEPLGFDRFKTCELMAELLHCSNMGLLNEIGSEEFVKARDIERERLKAEGKLAISPNQLPSQDDDLTMKSSTQTRLGSPDGSRKLEVQNATDDDGFEEVTHAADLGDDAKDDFDEKHGEEDLLGPPKSTPLSFLDKDDEEFVDEPLSSPRLQSVELSRPHLEPDMMPQPLSPGKDLAQQIGPLSPTKELSQKVGSLDLTDDEDTDMTSPPPSVDAHTEDSEQSTADTEKILQEPSDKSSEAPQQEVQVGEHSAAVVEEVTPQDLETLPHPEDKPAPLFAKKADTAAETSDAVIVPEVNASAESLDTTMGEAGDSSNSVMMENTDDHQLSLMDDASTPVVGDFLKMQFVEHKVVPTILDFFFRFPWNNFLHNVVYDVVQQVFNGPMDRGFNRMLAIDLFETGNITMRIVDGQKKSDEAQEKNRMRLGYMGHLTLIAEEVVKFTERHPPELLSESVLDKVSNVEWVNYVEVTLSETRERDNAILGGVRPDMSVGPRQAVTNAINAANNFGGASSALTEAGLNGSVGLDSIDLANGNGVNGGSFTLTSGTLLSGFGSSSDEEDDEMDEDNDEDGSRNSGAAEVGHSVPPAPNLDKFDDEEVDFEYLEQLDRETPLFPEGGFSRYISTPSTTTATSHTDLEPPSQPPPPPPPLNIPPSRARRQLAARLALHSKQSLLGSSNGEKSVSQEREEREIERERRQLNPFATEEDEDSDDAEAEEREKGLAISDIEAEIEGRGGIPAGSSLVGSDEKISLVDSEGIAKKDGNEIENVGSPTPADHPVVVVFSSPEQIGGNGEERRTFPSLWPFGAGSPGRKNKRFQGGGKKMGNAGGWGGDEDEGDREGGMMGEDNDRGTFEGVSADFYQQSDEDSDSDEDFGNLGELTSQSSQSLGVKGEGGSGGKKGGKRRLSVTTEAKRRTSLEDDDEEGDEGVVHVGISEGIEGHVLGVDKEGKIGGEEGKAKEEEGDDGELVEIQHAEMQGVEGGAVK